MPDINPDPGPCGRCGASDPSYRGSFGYSYLCDSCRKKIQPDGAMTDGGLSHGKHYARRQARSQRATERRNRLVDGRVGRDV